MSDDHDLIAKIERLDRSLTMTRRGNVRSASCATTASRFRTSDLDDATLHARLWELINAMAAACVFVESTDHLSDRELYRYLVAHGLCEETLLPTPGSGGGWHLSPIDDAQPSPTPNSPSRRSTAAR